MENSSLISITKNMELSSFKKIKFLLRAIFFKNEIIKIENLFTKKNYLS